MVDRGFKKKKMLWATNKYGKQNLFYPTLQQIPYIARKKIKIKTCLVTEIKTNLHEILGYLVITSHFRTNFDSSPSDFKMSLISKICRSSFSVLLRNRATCALFEKNELITTVRKSELHREISTSSCFRCHELQHHSAAVLHEFGQKLKVDKVAKTKKIGNEDVKLFGITLEFRM